MEPHEVWWFIDARKAANSPSGGSDMSDLADMLRQARAEEEADGS